MQKITTANMQVCQVIKAKMINEQENSFHYRLVADLGFGADHGNQS